MEGLPWTIEEHTSTTPNYYTNKMGTLKDKVFLSYADEDTKIAKRVHEDLQRSRKLEVWAYKESRKYGVNFKEEFETQIRQSTYFCLLDSPSARQSSWIAGEWKLAGEAKATRYICSLKNWTDGADWREKELFTGQNLTTAIDLSDYGAGIRELCRALQANFFPWSAFPRDHDFDKEVHSSNLDESQTQELIDLYRGFREHFADPEFAEALLRVVIKKCEVYRATKVISAGLALGVMQADAARHQDALRTFENLTRQHERDPRVWAAVAAACFHLGQYSRSLDALTRSRECVLNYYKEESAQHTPEIVHNIANVLILLERLDDAQKEIDALPTGNHALPFIRGMKGRILFHRGRYREALPYLKGAYEESMDVLPVLTVNLADCYTYLGLPDDELRLIQRAVKQLPASPEIWNRAAHCFQMRRDFNAALNALRNAVQLAKDVPQYRAQLAALLCKVNRIEEGRAVARECVKLSAPTAHDRYYRGLAFYVLGKKLVAEEELTESRSDPVVSKWPHYSEVFDRRTAG
jgi:tetratricopeptide (TPR) repeat protein